MKSTHCALHSRNFYSLSAAAMAVVVPISQLTSADDGDAECAGAVADDVTLALAAAATGNTIASEKKSGFCSICAFLARSTKSDKNAAMTGKFCIKSGFRGCMYASLSPNATPLLRFCKILAIRVRPRCAAGVRRPVYRDGKERERNGTRK